MKNPSPRFFLPVVLALGALAGSPASLTDENENYRQLQAMPRERRVALLENLERFDKLDPAEQAKIRKLNAEIAGKNPVDQGKYRSIMRRYQLWVSGLTEAQQEELRSTDDPEARFNLALKFRKSEQAASSNARRIHGIRSGYFGLMPPFEAAQLLRIWNKMNAPQKAQAERQEVRAHLAKEIRDLGKVVGVQPHPFPNAEEKRYDAILDGSEDFKKQLGQFSKRVDATPKKDESAKAKGEHVQTKFEFRFTEFLYFEDPAHKLKPVSQQNLEKFADWCPTWFHSMMDPLSAEDARNYLSIIYRLIFNEHTEHPEITADWKPLKAKASAVPGAPRPAPKRTGAPGPL